MTISKLLRFLFSTALCVVFGLVIVDIIVGRYPGYFNIPIVGHPIFNHVWIPNAQIVNKEYEQVGIPSYIRTTDVHGWLTKEDIPIDKPTNEFRLFFLGDSYTEGTCAEEDSMPARVSFRLSPVLSKSGKYLRVINTGTRSYSPLIYYLRLRDEILQFHPDTIVINVDMTDVFDDFLYTKSSFKNASGEIRGSSPIGPLDYEYKRVLGGLRHSDSSEKALTTLAPISALSRALLFYSVLLRFHETPLPDMPRLFDWCNEPWDRRTSELVQAMLNHLAEAIRLAKNQNIRVIVSAVPHLPQFQGTWSTKPFKLIQETALSEGAEYFDLFGAMKGAIQGTDPQELYIPSDMHLSIKGYHLWGDLFGDWLAAKM